MTATTERPLKPIKPGNAKSPLVALKRAKKLLSDPRRWTQGEYGRDTDGSNDVIGEGQCVSFCALGALAVVSGSEDEDLSPGRDALKSVLKGQSKSMADVDFNDSLPRDARGHRRLMQWFDRAIKWQAKQDEKAAKAKKSKK